MNYNTTYSPTNPFVPGLLSGTYVDGTDVFPGTSVFPSCGNVEKPARVSSSIIGGNIACNTGEMFNAPNSKYFAKLPNLLWASTNLASLSITPGAIKVTNKYNVLRFNLTSGSKVYQQIGVYEPSVSSFYNGLTGLIVQNQADNFEVLTCSTCANGGSGFYCCLNGANNGSFDDQRSLHYSLRFNIRKHYLPNNWIS